MRESIAQPVFIFLPMRGPARDEGERVVDPVCGRALAGGEIVGRLRHDERHHYFCSLECAERFAVSARGPEAQ
jgi:YHS domain-containing protein